MVSDPMPDPVSSLRAAALSTLKSKRRKPAIEKKAPQVQSRPPPPSDSLQLDYGLEEASQDVSMTDGFIVSSAVAETKEQTSIPIDGDVSREEGEISEEEEPLSSSRKASTPQRSKTPTPAKPPTSEPKSVVIEANSKRSSPPPRNRPTPEARAPSLLDRISEPASHAALSEEQSIVDVQMPDAPSSAPLALLSSLGPDSVRPGLLCKSLSSSPKVLAS